MLRLATGLCPTLSAICPSWEVVTRASRTPNLSRTSECLLIPRRKPLSARNRKQIHRKNTKHTKTKLLKSCIGNRALGWDLLPPGTAEITEKPETPSILMLATATLLTVGKRKYCKLDQTQNPRVGSEILLTPRAV